MSATGDQYPTVTPLDSGAKGSSGGNSSKSVLRSELDDGDGRSLPIRLSITQGGLGIELSRPLSLGLTRVEAFEVGLLGIKYPVDLSKGVKKFRHRRSRLVRAVVAVELEELSELWGGRLSELWGERPNVRLRPVYQKRSSPALATNDQEESGIEAISIGITSSRAALAFDLVVASGMAPSLVVDAPRTWGHAPLVVEASPLQLALRVVDTVMGKGAAELSWGRSGRVVELGGLARWLALSVFPDLGCRLPEVENQVIVSLRARGGRLCVELGAWGEPFRSTRRAMRVHSAAQVLLKGDNRLATGDVEGARAAYLEALELAPGQPDVLLELADIDLCSRDRAESALGFLEELDASPTAVTRPGRVRKHLAWSRALSVTGRKDASREALEQALEAEPEGCFAALLGYQLSREVESADRRRRLIDAALKRAPYLHKLREARLLLSLETADTKTVAADAAHLEAAERNDSGRARVCLFVGRAYLDTGNEAAAATWFRRALRFRPDEPEIKIQLARGLSRCAAHLRAAELLSSAQKDIERELSRLESSHSPDLGVLDRLQHQRAEVHFRLAQVLLEEDDSNVSSALAQLASVPLRSEWGAAARLQEARLHQRANRAQHRDRALLRLLEAVELGWIPEQGLTTQFEPFYPLIEADGDRTLLDFAERVLGSRSPFDGDKSFAPPLSEDDLSASPNGVQAVDNSDAKAAPTEYGSSD